MTVSTESTRRNRATRTRNLIINGSFQNGPNPGQSLKLNPGSTAIQGWVVTRAPIDYVGTLWQAANGDRSLDLDGAGAGGIAQTFDTVPGESYVVTFSLAGNPLGAPPIKLLGVTAAGQSANFAFNISGRTPTNMGWETKRWMFMAQSNKTTLEFFSLNTSGGSWGPALDSVLVVLA
ncbi:choice-of-anchor C family protein [Cyanobacteria bacterium FACHB-472]|nr:choice-of-anchor C family protein [Cyanobacteria bacterium FACHB-472]